MDTDFVKVLEKGLRRARELNDLLPICAFLLHRLQRSRFEHLNWLDVDVTICDDHRASVVSDQARTA